MEILIDKFIEYDFLASHKLLAKIISPDSYMVGNFLCAGGGVAISGSSFINFCTTRNGLAKTCYVISGLCGGTAVICGAYSGLTSYYGLSKFAAGGDIIGGSFLWVGNKAHKFGNYVEEKKWCNLNRFRPRNLVRRPVPKRRMGLGYKGMSFVTPAPLDISFETILIIGGIVITIYSYGKIIIAISRYIKKKCSPKMDHSLIIYSSARFLVDSLNESEYSKKVNRIYHAALGL